MHILVRGLTLILTLRLIPVASPPCSHLCSATHEISPSSCSLRIISGSRHLLLMSCPSGPRGVVSREQWAHLGHSLLVLCRPQSPVLKFSASLRFRGWGGEGRQGSAEWWRESGSLWNAGCCHQPLSIGSFCRRPAPPGSSHHQLLHSGKHPEVRRLSSYSSLSTFSFLPQCEIVMAQHFQ